MTKDNPRAIHGAADEYTGPLPPEKEHQLMSPRAFATTQYLRWKGEPPEVRVLNFRGCNVACILFESGERFWIAKDIGRALGYADDGGRLVTKVTGDWSEEFDDGTEYTRLTKAAINNLRALGLPTDSVGSRAREAIALSESGLTLALAKGDKLLCKAFRRFVARDDKPMMRFTERLQASMVDGQFMGLRSSPESKSAEYVADAEREERREERTHKERMAKIEIERRQLADARERYNSEYSIQLCDRDRALGRERADAIGELVKLAVAAGAHSLAANLRVQQIGALTGLDLGWAAEDFERIVAEVPKHDVPAVVAALSGAPAVKRTPNRAVGSEEPAPRPANTTPDPADPYHPTFAELGPGWHSMTAIARELGCHRNPLGKVARPLGLKNGPHTRKYWVQRADTDWHEAFAYDDYGAELIRLAWLDHAKRTQPPMAGPTYSPGAAARQLGTSAAGVGKIARRLGLLEDAEAVVFNGVPNRYSLTQYGLELVREGLAESRGQAA